MLSVVVDETGRRGLWADWRRWPVRAPGACWPPPWRSRSTTTWLGMRPNVPRVAGGWWSATATPASAG
jgi:hypothetical protein